MRVGDSESAAAGRALHVGEIGRRQCRSLQVEPGNFEREVETVRDPVRPGEHPALEPGVGEGAAGDADRGAVVLDPHPAREIRKLMPGSLNTMARLSTSASSGFLSGELIRRTGNRTVSASALITLRRPSGPAR